MSVPVPNYKSNIGVFMVKIAVAGAKGHMGKMIIDAVWNTEGAELVAALAHKGTDKWEADEDAGASLATTRASKLRTTTMCFVPAVHKY